MELEKFDKVSMAFFDRRTCNLPKCQVGFIQFFVLPLYEEVAAVFPAAQGPLVQTMRNKNQWIMKQEEGEETAGFKESGQTDDDDDDDDGGDAVTVQDLDTAIMHGRRGSKKPPLVAGAGAGGEA